MPLNIETETEVSVYSEYILRPHRQGIKMMKYKIYNIEG